MASAGCRPSLITPGAVLSQPLGLPWATPMHFCYARHSQAKEIAVTQHELIALDCPYCEAEIYRPLTWFRQPYFTCPACGGGLAAGQFATVVDEIDAALEASVAEMLEGQSACGGGCRCGH